jgi:hypothetical protein
MLYAVIFTFTDRLLYAGMTPPPGNQQLAQTKSRKHNWLQKIDLLPGITLTQVLESI